jgi:hypothetical protein
MRLTVCYKKCQDITLIGGNDVPKSDVRDFALFEVVMLSADVLLGSID